MVEIGREYDGDLYKSVVIDGNNAITVKARVNRNTQKKHYDFSLERLFNTIQSVEKLGWRTLTVLKEGTYYRCLKPNSNLTDSQRDVLKKMKETGMIHIINNPKEGNDPDLDDKIMIEHALKHDAWILTGDSFQYDHIPKLMDEKKFDVINEINKRRVNLTFGPDNKPLFCLPENIDALEATKVVSDTQNLELELMSGGCPIQVYLEGWGEFSGIIPMRQPVGRKEVFRIVKSRNLESSINAISRNHFKLDWDGRCFYFTDLKSTNGTKIGGLRIPPHQPQKLSPDDIITIASVEIRLR